MALFTGVSVITDGEHSTTLAIDAGTDNGYHLLVVKDYSRTVKEIPNGEAISTGSFTVGGLKWYILYSPNGLRHSTDFISVYLCRDDVDTTEVVKVRCVFSFVDQVEYQKPTYIRATELHSLSSGKADYCGYDKFMKSDALERSTHLKDDCFTIRCDVMVCKDSNTQDVGDTISDIGQHLDYLLQNKVGADVIFEVSGETFPAHRCVLAARSTVFMAQLFGPMREGTTSGVIQIKDMEAKVFKALLSFIYTGSFPEMDKDNNMEDHKAELVEEGQEEEEAVENLMWLQALFVAADRYDLQRLKIVCEEDLSEQIAVSSVASILALAEQHHCHGLKESCLKFIQVLPPEYLGKVMATDGWKHVATTYPSVLDELIVMLASNQKDKKRKHERM